LEGAISIRLDTAIHARPALKFLFDFFGCESIVFLLGHGVLPVLTRGQYHGLGFFQGSLALAD
jgi:hypothetical protein